MPTFDRVFAEALQKARVRAHTRKVNGKVVQVREHEDSRPEKKQPALVPEVTYPGITVNWGGEELPLAQHNGLQPPRPPFPDATVLGQGLHTGTVWEHEGKAWKRAVHRVRMLEDGPDGRPLFAVHEFRNDGAVDAIRAIADLPRVPSGIEVLDGGDVLYVGHTACQSPSAIGEDIFWSMVTQDDIEDIEETLRMAAERGIQVNDTLQLGYDPDRGIVVMDWSNAHIEKPFNGRWPDGYIRQVTDLYRKVGNEGMAVARELAQDVRHDAWGMEMQEGTHQERRYVYGSFNRPAWLGMTGAIIDLDPDCNPRIMPKPESQAEHSGLWLPHDYVVTEQPLSENTCAQLELTPLHIPPVKPEKLEKGVKIKGRPGLQLKQVQTRDGRPVRRWVKVATPQKEGRPAPVTRGGDPAEEYKRLGTRAPAFKAWFGDWEADPASASKVVNGDGEPQETYNITKAIAAMRKAVGEQKVKVRTRVRHTKTGTVIQPAHTETRKKAEPKASVKWVKGEDPFDGSPRYSIEGRNPGSSYERVTAVIVQEKEYNEFTFRKEPRYYGSVYDNKAEYAIDVGPFRAVKDAKVATEQAFHRMMADIAREEAQKQAEAQRANVNQVPPDQEIPDKPTPLRLVSENANYTIELEPSDDGASFTARMISSYGEEKASQTFPADQWVSILSAQLRADWTIQSLQKAVQKVNVRTIVRQTMKKATGPTKPVKVRQRVLNKKTGVVVQPAHTETRKKAEPKLSPPKRPLKPEQKRAREKALGLPEDKRKWTRKQFAEWLRVTAPDNDVTRACIANALDPNKPAPEYGLTYDRFQQIQTESQERQEKLRERDQAAAEGRHVWEHSGQVYYGPEPKGVVGTGLRPAIAMFEVKGDRVFMVADETTLQNRYKQALAIMRETGRAPKLQGILVTLDETKAEKEWQQRAQAFASQNAEDKDDAEGLLTPEARRAYEARAVKEKPAHRLKKALQWLLRKATEETQDVKVRTRVLHKKTGLVVQPAHTEKRKKAAPKPEREKSVQATEDATAKPGPKQRTNRRTGKGAPTSRTARGIITSRADLLPPVDLTACPQAIQTNLSEDQVEGVARAVVALDKQGGFIMADGTGVGKTRQILALARIYQERGHPVLIVAPSEVIKQDWKTGAYYGSYQEDAAAVGVTPQLIDGSKDRLKKGQVGITTYHHQKRVLPEDLPPGTVVLFDEAHALKNSTGGQPSGTAKWGIELANAAHSVVYATATPMDKAIHLPYLFRAGVFEGKTMEAALQELGLEYKHRRKKLVGGKWVDPSGWVIKQGLTNREVVRRIEQLFDRVTAAGCMLKREVSLEGLNVQLHGITAPPEARELMRSIESRYLRYNEETGETTIDPLSKARMMQDQRRHLEPFKISAAVAMIKDELAKGRHVAVFVARVNPSESADVNKDVNGDIISKTVFAQTEGTAVALRDALRAEGIEDVIEMHGQATKTSSEKKRAQDRFQAGDGRVLITTVESGGTGINLDDRIGDAPRTLICLTPPFTAPGVAQMVGRVLRRTTVSNVDVKFIFTGEEVDKWNARIANDKLAMLGASVKGDIASRIQLDEGIIDWITDEDAPYQFYNPNVIVIQQGRDYAEDEKPEPKQLREKKQAEPSKEPPAEPATPAQPVSGSGSGIPVEHRIFITKKGKAKPVFAFKLPGRMDKETYAAFSAAYGWRDSATGMYMVADKPENEALVARITGTQPQRTLKKGLWGGLRVRITKGFMRTHMSGGSRSYHHRLRRERP